MTRRVLLPVTTVLGLLLAWEATVRVLDLAPFVLPAPSRVAQAAIRSAPVLPGHVATTLSEAALGLVLGAAAGTVLALGVVLRPRAGDALEPLVLLTQTVPTVVLAPLLILWAGFGLLPKVLLVALTVFFPVFVSATSAMRSADTDLLDVVAGLGGGAREQLLVVRLPGAVAGAAAGLRVAATYTVGAAVVAEYLAGQSGLGVYIQRSRKAYAVDQVLVGVIVVALLTALLVGAVVLLERSVTPWRPRARGRIPAGAPG
ncbi:ABC transporter permease [Actinotalea sp. M2MS4P-6]|uniref:ABC transporter permease n=1 Tax=Actinotalea sp. M2MS4P-6 TaxID=2983762 RepID=UPI0021E4915E|nr:ABC transporter permease [Actinotalea sp. M2MS4P-6]MCV2393687.1 ABC transporter permease [Actinotalea sp. M2MS4P-6]